MINAIENKNTLENEKPKKEKKPGYFKREMKKFKKHKSIMWFVLPAMLVAFVLSYIPMIGILFSFKEELRFNYWLHDFVCNGCDLSYCLKGGFNPGWTFSHYASIFKDEYFIIAVKNTLVISGLKLVIIFPLTIVFAIMLSEIKSQKLSKLVLILACLPNFISWPVALGIWKNIFGEQTGMINVFMSNLYSQGWFQNLFNVTANSYTPIEFFNEWYLFLVIFFAAWKTIGWGSIMYYAAIVSIDKSYYEAATIDGATKMQKIRYLTIPSILPLIALMLVMNITYIMDAGFDQVFTMLKMSPNLTYDNQILGTYIFNLVLENTKGYPFTVALSVFNGFIALDLMLGGNFIVKKTLNKSLW